MGARTILYTGKGGVGKTSVAAATGRRLAGEGHRVLLVSTDPAHSLGDVLGRGLDGGTDPIAVGPGLDALQLEPQRELDEHWGDVRAWAGRTLVGRGVDRISAEELTVPPGLEELLCLLRLVRLRETGDHDVVVVDCAPTGETLRLLAFPDVARWWIDRVVPRQEQLLGAARPLVRAMLDVSLPDASVLDEVGRLMESLLAMRDVLRDATTTSVRLVTTADRVVLDETRRTFTYLALQGVPTDAVVVNRLFPADVGPYFAAWRERQRSHLEEIEDAFAPLPVLRAPYLPDEVVGTEALDVLGDALYAGVDAAAVLVAERPREIEVLDGEVRLRIAVPLVDRADVRLRRAGDELVVEVGTRRRTVLLPPAVAHYRPTGATFRDGVLEVVLHEPRESAPTA